MPAAQTLPAPHSTSTRLAPSPPTSGLMGHLGPLTRGEQDYLVRIASEYGDVVRLRFGPLTCHLISRPDDIKRVLLDEHKRYSKRTRSYDMLREFLGNGLLTSEGEFHKRQRRLAQPAFHHHRIAAFADRFVDEATGLADAWEVHADTGQSVDVSAEMMRLTLAVVGQTLLSTDLTTEAAEVGEALGVVLEETDRRINDPLDTASWLPTPRHVRFWRAKRLLRRVVADVIAQRRALAEPPADLLSMLMAARDEDTGEGMDDQQLADEVMTMFLAGHETTANLLSWTFVMLSRHPDVLRRVEAEVDQLGGRRLALQDARNLQYTSQVLKESLRLYPPAWMLERRVEQEDELSGFRIDKGSFLIISPYVTHRLARWWPNPEGFDPDRFAPDVAPGPKDFRYFPFGGGPRICIGKGFAMLEATLMLATLVSRYRLELVPGAPIEAKALVTLRPRFGAPMVIRRRAS